MNRTVLALAIIAAFLRIPFSLAAESTAAFYQGRQITMLLGSAPGDDYDSWGRLIARHMGRHIPGTPLFIVQNMPGAGFLVAANYLFNRAPQDGTVIGMVSRNIPNQGILHLPNAHYDPLKFNWLGSPEFSHRACFARADSGIATAQDLFERELLVGGTGAGTAVTETPLLLKKLLGMKFRLVEGYPGARDAVLALQRNEISGICQTLAAFAQEMPGAIEAGKVRVLFTMEEQPIAALKVPTIFDFAKTEEQRRILAFHASGIELGRPVLAPPNVPADRVAALRRAFNATMTDKAFRAEAAQMGLAVTPRTGEEIAAIIEFVAATPPELIRRVEAMTQP